MEQSTGNDWGRESWNYHRSTVKQDTVNIFNLQVGLRTNTKSVLLGDSRGKSEVHHTLPSARITCNTSAQQMIKRFPKANITSNCKHVEFLWQYWDVRKRKNRKYCIFSGIKVKRNNNTVRRATHCKSYNKSRLQSHFFFSHSDL